MAPAGLETRGYRPDGGVIRWHGLSGSGDPRLPGLAGGVVRWHGLSGSRDPRLPGLACGVTEPILCRPDRESAAVTGCPLPDPAAGAESVATGAQNFAGHPR